MILYIETPGESPKKIKKATGPSKFSKIAGYKVSIQNSIIFLYTSNEQSTSKIKNTILFTVASK